MMRLVLFILLSLACSSDAFTNRAQQSRRLVHQTHDQQQHHQQQQPFLALRGGAMTSLPSAFKAVSANPTSLFNSLFVALSVGVLALKGAEAARSRSKSSNDATSTSSSSSSSESVKPASVKSLQMRFLAVFWLMRMADWLQGPYFYEVYASKVIGGAQVSLDMVSKLFLVGFASTGLFGPWIGRLVDSVGRKAGTIAFAVLYILGALSTRSSLLPLLLLGRIAGGIGTSLLFSAPEAWLVGEHQREGHDGKWLGQTFGWAYAGDSLVAIAAGQLASMMAAKVGSTGPFSLSVLFLALGSVLAAFQWKENVAQPVQGGGNNKPSIADAWQVMIKDKRILLVGAMQAFFEGAMYIFVLSWVPAIKAAIAASGMNGATDIPFGKIFSCFMANCLIGSTIFGSLQSRGVFIETVAASMLGVAALAMGLAAYATSIVSTSTGGALALLVASFFVFEACVGMYFPSIGTLRSKYLPDTHRSVIMNIFGLPLNLIVVSVFMSIRQLGVRGALSIATLALSTAGACSFILAKDVGKKKQ